MITPKTIARRKKTAIEAGRKLDAAAVALRRFVSACNECGDESASLGVLGKGFDGRDRLIGDCSEYAAYLDSKFNKPEISQ